MIRADIFSLIGYEQAAARLRVPINTLRYWVHKGTVPHHRLGSRSVAFDVKALDAWAAARKASR